MDIDQEIESLKNALREVMQLVAQRGDPLSNELKFKIAQVMEHVATRIQELRQQQQEAPITSPVPEMQQSMPSSNIHSFNYDYDNGRLLVKYQGDRGPGEGPIYSYEGVPPYLFNLFRKGAAIAKTTGKNKWGQWWKGKSPSIGAAMHAFIINGNYPHNRIG